MIRAVVDPGVLIAGLISSTGSPATIIDTAREGLFDLVACPTLLAEVRRALGYPKLQRYVSEDEADAFVAWLARTAVVGPDPEDISAISRDPDDDYLFALALDAGATCIVSGDADLLDLHSPPVRVLTPKAFLTTLG